MLKVGPCCICEKTKNVRNVIILPHPNDIPGHGWGCLACGLKNDGAIAVVCDACFNKYAKHLEKNLKFYCPGYPLSEGRKPIAQLSKEPFNHNMQYHQNEQNN